MAKYKKIINQDRRRQVLDYINENYSLSSLLKDLGVWDGSTTVIKCPFHADSRPSFNIDSDNNRYKCFSCGSGGGYMSFYYKYHTETLEEDKYFNDYVEEILSSDYNMQESLGYSTIFVKVETIVALKDLAQFEYKKPNLINVDVRSLETIRRKVIKEGVDTLMDFYADVERGLNLDDLWSRYYLGVHSDAVKMVLETKESIMSEFDALFDDIEESSTNSEDELLNQIDVYDNQSNINLVTTSNKSNEVLTELFSDELDDIQLMNSFGKLNDRG